VTVFSKARTKTSGCCTAADATDRSRVLFNGRAIVSNVGCSSASTKCRARGRVRVRHTVVFVVACLGFSLQPRVAQSQSVTQASQLVQAKELFRRGVALLNAGQTEPALEAFLRSRAVLPSSKNTVNAAICLERLGRYDEAFELYQEVVARFAGDLAPEDRENLAPVIAALRKKIGYLELSANAAGAVTVAGRPRGVLPFNAALPILPGRQTIRIQKDGYDPFESTVELRAGDTKRMNARLEPWVAQVGSSLEEAEPARVAPAASRTRVRPRRWQLELGANLGGLYTPRTHAGLEAYCRALCGRDRGVLGAMAELSIALRHRSGLGAELAGGYAFYRQKLARAAFDGDVTYALDETLMARGVTTELRARFDRPLGLGLDFSSSAGGGLWFSAYTSQVSGLAWTVRPTGATAAQSLPKTSSASASDSSPFISLSLGLEHQIVKTSIGLALAAWFFPTTGSRAGGPTLGAGPPCSVSTQNALGCSSRALERERTHGNFWLLNPQLTLRYAL
jgi:PEGA domain